jgi:hypothetical protein
MPYPQSLQIRIWSRVGEAVQLKDSGAVPIDPATTSRVAIPDAASSGRRNLAGKQLKSATGPQLSEGIAPILQHGNLGLRHTWPHGKSQLAWQTSAVKTATVVIGRVRIGYRARVTSRNAASDAQKRNAQSKCVAMTSKNKNNSIRGNDTAVWHQQHKTRGITLCKQHLRNFQLLLEILTWPRNSSPL